MTPLTILVSNVSIPDTVIVKYEQPVAWYFMSQGEIKAKNKANLNFEQVKKRFLRRVPPSGVVATFMKKIENDLQGRYTFHHLTKPEFCKKTLLIASEFSKRKREHA